MRRKSTRFAALVLASALAASAVLTGCGSTDSSDSASDSASTGSTSMDEKSAEFTYLIQVSMDGVWYDDYDDNPCAQYWLSREWDADGDGEGKILAIDFWAPTSGAETDYVNTIISTGEYPDVLEMTYSSESALELYEEGIALDLTEYVEAYMPNYLAYIAEHPEYTFTTSVDGEAKYIQLLEVRNELETPWGGFLYRRDWIVKYGANPVTGAAFYGEWVDGEWVDDVVFPSGNTDPATITDWEWMMEIFETALEELGITDGYAVQLTYSGATGTGDLVSGFGGIGPALYYDANGNVAFGGTSDGLRAYVECMTEWYSNGWIDPAFAERASDMYFMIDSATVYSGKVGLWYGLVSQALDNLDPGDGSNPYLDGAVVFACTSPINDKYGDTSVQGTEPTVFYQASLVGTGPIITDKAADKDIATLLTAIDYLYSDEGSVLRTRGMNKEILDANPDAEYTQTYIEWGLEDGAYTMDGDTIVVSQVINDNNNDLNDAATMFRIVGMGAYANVDLGYSQTKEHLLDVWTSYTATGYIQSDLTNQLSSSAYSAYSAFRTNILTLQAQWLPLYIMGQLDVTSDADWQSYVDEVNALNPDEIVSLLQAVKN